MDEVEGDLVAPRRMSPEVVECEWRRPEWRGAVCACLARGWGWQGEGERGEGEVQGMGEVEGEHEGEGEAKGVARGELRRVYLAESL